MLIVLRFVLGNTGSHRTTLLGSLSPWEVSLGGLLQQLMMALRPPITLVSACGHLAYK